MWRGAMCEWWLFDVTRQLVGQLISLHTLHSFKLLGTLTSTGEYYEWVAFASIKTSKHQQNAFHSESNIIF